MKRFLILVSILWSVWGMAQNKHTDPLWLLKSGSSNLTTDFNKGYNAFYLDSIPDFEKRLDSIPYLLGKDKKILFIHNRKPDQLPNLFSDTFKDSTHLWQPLKGQLQLVKIQEIDFISFSEDSDFRNTLCKDLKLVFSDSLKTRDEINNFLTTLLHKKGVVPDVIATPYISDVDYLKASLYKKPTYEAEVLFNGKALERISWKEFPHLETCGLFKTSDSTLSPQKRGFMFSPDIYNFTDKNTKITGPKIFRAIKYELGEKLRYSIPLNGEISNLAQNEGKSTSTDIQFKEDSFRNKKVAFFNGTSSYIDIRSTPEDKLDEISISAWVNPNEIDGSFSLIGKGEAFSAKIYNGRLQFTTTGIKDHVTSENLIEKNTWSHVAFVYVPRQNLYFYLNGKLIDRVSASDIRQTDHALLIGTNLWGQHYSGLMSDLKIWHRALSDNEIENIYVESVSGNQGGGIFNEFLLYGVMVLFLVMGLLLIRGKKLEKRKIIKPIIKKFSKPSGDENFNRNCMNLLNGFEVWNLNGEEITSRFSPKRKELLILILLFTLKEEGITSKKMSDILWPGFPAVNKKNNRSTQIKELRKILDNQLDAQIIFEDKKWQIRIAEPCKIDVFLLNKTIPDFWKSRKSAISTDQAIQVSQIVSRGALLPQIEEEWLDPIKADYNSKVLNMLNPFLENDTVDNTEKLEIIDAILVVDPLFETAVKKKVACLLQAGKYGSAKKTVENYKKLYESYYNETIDPDFINLIK